MNSADVSAQKERRIQMAPISMLPPLLLHDRRKSSADLSEKPFKDPVMVEITQPEAVNAN